MNVCRKQTTNFNQGELGEFFAITIQCTSINGIFYNTKIGNCSGIRTGQI